MQIKTVLTSTASSAQREAPDPSVGKVGGPSAAQNDLSGGTEDFEQGMGRSIKPRFGEVFDALAGQEATNTSKPEPTEMSATSGEDLVRSAPDLAQVEAETAREVANREQVGKEWPKQAALESEQQTIHRSGSEKLSVVEARTVEDATFPETYSRNTQDFERDNSTPPLTQDETVSKETGRHLETRPQHVEMVRSEIGSAVTAVTEDSERAIQPPIEGVQSTASLLNSEKDEDRASPLNPSIAKIENEVPVTRNLGESVVAGDRKAEVQNGRVEQAMLVEGKEALARDLTKFETLGQFSQMPKPSKTATFSTANHAVASDLLAGTNYRHVKEFGSDQRNEPFAESVFSLRTQIGADRSGLVLAAFETQVSIDEVNHQRPQDPILQGAVAESHSVGSDQKISATLSIEASDVALGAQKSLASQEQSAKLEPVLQGPAKVLKSVRLSPQAQANGTVSGEKRTAPDGGSQALSKNGEITSSISDVPIAQKPVAQAFAAVPPAKMRLAENADSNVSAGTTEGEKRRNDLVTASQAKIVASSHIEGEQMIGRVAASWQVKAEEAFATSQIAKPEMHVRVARPEPERSPTFNLSTTAQTDGAKVASAGERALTEPFALGNPAEAAKLEATNLPPDSDEVSVAEHRLGRTLSDSASQRVRGEFLSQLTSQPVAAQPILGEQVALSLANEGGQSLQISAAEIDGDADLFDPVLREVRGDTGVQSAANTQTGAQNGPSNNVRQFAAQIHEALAKGSQRPVEITLNPQELGAVRMAMQMSEASIGLTIMIERPETLDLLRRHIDQLVADFKELGYENIDLSLSSGGFSGQDAPEQDDATADTVSISQDDVDEALPVQQLPPSSAGTATGVDLRV